MYRISAVFVFIQLIFSAFFAPVSLNAEESYIVSGTIVTTATFRWNNENWFTELHPKIAEFTVRDDGSAFGYTETGVFFNQENISNDLSLRIQRFSMQDHFHYIIEGKEVYTPTEMSQELALAYFAAIKDSLKNSG
jgi:hypothetical protein